MDFDEIDFLRRNDPAWRLLRADNAPLILGFFRKVFVDDNVRSISAAELVSRLDDELYALNERLGESTFPKAAKAYLDDWAGPANGWLRKYYPTGSDEVHFDATPAAEKALTWVDSLRARSFVGTESRLNTIFELLRQMAFGAETDPDVRLTELHRLRTEIDVEINRVTGGDFAVLDDSEGYAASRLRPLTWLAKKNLVYWGDIDTHGFAILNSVRRSFGSARSMLMDRATLLAHEGQWVSELTPTSEHLEALLPDEASLYADLVEGTLGKSVRLEQERVSYAAIQHATRQCR